MYKRTYVLLMGMLLCGCGQPTNPMPPQEITESAYDPFALPADGAVDADDVSFCYGLAEEAGEISCQSPMELALQVGNSSPQPQCFGTVLFVDGIMQTFRVEDGDAATLYAQELKPEEIRVFRTSFSPTVDADLSRHSVQIGLIYAPDFVPESGTGSYGNHQRLHTYRLPLTDVPADIGTEMHFPQVTSRPLTDAEQNMELYRSSVENGTAMIVLEKAGIPQDADENGFVASDSLTVRMLGGRCDGRYRVSVICGGKPVAAFQGSTYVDMTVGAGEMAEFPCDMVAFPVGETLPVYAVAVPLSSEDGMLQTRRMTWRGGAT